MEIGSNVPKTLVALCKRDGRITEVWTEDPDMCDRNNYWATLADGWNWCDCGSIHETTIKDFRNALKAVRKDLNNEIH